MVDTFVGNQGQAPETGQFLVLRTADNTVAFVPPSGVSVNATMATWARRSDRLYYRDAIGVRTWDAGVASVGTLATALHWYDPAASPDGRWQLPCLERHLETVHGEPRGRHHQFEAFTTASKKSSKSGPSSLPFGRSPLQMSTPKGSTMRMA